MNNHKEQLINLYTKLRKVIINQLVVNNIISLMLVATAVYAYTNDYIALMIINILGVIFYAYTLFHNYIELAAVNNTIKRVKAL